MNVFSSSINLLEWLTESRKTVYVPDCQFVIRRIQLRNSQLEGKHRARPVGRARAATPLNAPLSPNLHGPANPRCSPNPILLGFMEAALGKRDNITGCGWSSQPPASLPPHPPRVEWVVGSPVNQLPSLGKSQKSPH